jgi:hypothetical protein
MPHLFTNRPRKYAIGVHKDELISHHTTWEKINVLAYEIGGILFIAGSVLFLPKYGDYRMVPLSLPVWSEHAVRCSALLPAVRALRAYLVGVYVRVMRK